MEGMIQEDVRQLDLQAVLNSDSVFNPELSWLSFNWRVLWMAADKRTPLFERLRFIAITSRNLDEFFGKRVGGLKRQVSALLLLVETGVLFLEFGAGGERRGHRV